MRLLRRASFVIIILLCFAGRLSAAEKDKKRSNRELAERMQWVDSVYDALTQEERIGQLFTVQGYSGGKNYNEELITKLLAAHQIGGITFMQGGPVRQALLTNQYQHLAHVPLLISMDAEWGIGMRLTDSIKSFPRQMMLGATRDTGLVYKIGAAIAAQCNRLGVHMDFAPDVDVNNNASNPVINSRSFGEDKRWVSKLGIAYMRGLQNNGVLACAKHFPGHGNTSVDSHNDLPVILQTVAQMDTLELVPFKQLMLGGIRSIMVAHLNVPALDTAAHMPTTLSKNAVTGLLKDRLGFKGLVITDALNMQGVTKYFPSGEAELRAFMAGNDILLFPVDVPLALSRINNALDSGLVPKTMLEASVKKILYAKYDAGLSQQWKDIETGNLVNDLNSAVDQLRIQAAKNAITIVKDDNQMLGRINENMRIGYVGINTGGPTPLYQKLDDEFNNVGKEWLPKGSSTEHMQRVLDGLSKYDATVIAVHNISFSPGGSYGLGDEAVSFLQQAGCRNNVIIVLLGNAYAMQYFCGAQSVLVSYEDDTLTELAVADVLLKKAKAKGRLPVTACLNGQSVCPAPARLPVVSKTLSNELVNVFYPDGGVIDKTALDRLDMFMARNIADGVFPGCRVLAAHNGKVFYDRAFGYQKYDKKRPIDTSTLYDMASCTKVLATTISVMRLYEQGKLDLNKTLGDYLPKARGTNKANLRIRDLLLHQAGLKGWIPFYKETVESNGMLKADLFRSIPTAGYNVAVAQNVYLRNDYIDTMWSKIYASGLDNAGKMVYSDLDFYFMAEVVHQITGKTIDKYADDEFYKPMGLKRILYNPLTRFDSSQIAPTEIETTFRAQTLQGYVHDPGAALLGGVGGHAGVFASAHDVAAIFQMLLNKGVYGTKRYFKPATIDLFTAYGSPISHRGLGWDKPVAAEDDGGPAGERCSGLAFGHQGFTGTCAWADPATGIVFVFLSNRVFPSGANTKINKLSVRTMSQDLIYQSLGIPVDHNRPAVFRTEVGK